MDKNEYMLNANGIDEISMELQKLLIELGQDRGEALRIRLTLEELLLRVSRASFLNSFVLPVISGLQCYLQHKSCPSTHLFVLILASGSQSDRPIRNQSGNVSRKTEIKPDTYHINDR